MNPRTPQLLNRVLELAEKSLDRVTGDMRRVADIDDMLIEARALIDQPPQERPRCVNEFTVMFLQSLRIAEYEGPLGNNDRIVCASTLGHILLPFIQRDALRAMELDRPATSEGAER